MVRIDVTYLGDLRTEAVHGPSGTRLVTDAPVDNHGRGEAFSPTDLVATALGTCLLTIMGIEAARNGWSIEGATASVEKRMITGPERRIRELAVVITVPGDFEEPTREALERAAATCPVHRTLGASVSLPLEFVWPG